MLRCSFCNRTQDDVAKLIAGPTVFICDACIAKCNEILADDERSVKQTASPPPQGELR